MKNATRKSSLGRMLAAGALVAGAMFAASGAMACTVDNWSSNFGDGLAAGDPVADGIARYQGLCGLEITGTGYVQDDSPGGIDRIVARFYVLNDNTAETTIYRGFSSTDGTGELFNVTLDDAGGVTLTDTSTGQSVSDSGATNWLSVEIDWVRDASGSISLKVNGQTEQSTSIDNSGSASLASVRLGNLDGAAGSVGFDSYESRRSTAVGRLLRADANNDGVITSGDITVSVNEIFDDTLATGQPDCNEDGNITSADITCTANVIFN